MSRQRHSHPQIQWLQRPRPALTACCVALLVLVGCSARRAAAPVAQAQREALNRLAESHVADLAAIRTLIEALTRIEREALQARLARALAARYLDAAGKADFDRLDADIAAPLPADAAPWSLATEVVSGALSREAARAILADFTDALTQPRDAQAEALASALAPLPPLRAQRDAADALLEALDARSAGVAKLLVEVGADADALDALRGLSLDPAKTLRTLAGELWRKSVLERLDDPEKRAAAERVLERLLGQSAPANAP